MTRRVRALPCEGEARTLAELQTRTRTAYYTAGSRPAWNISACWGRGVGSVLHEALVRRLHADGFTD